MVAAWRSHRQAYLVALLYLSALLTSSCADEQRGGDTEGAAAHGWRIVNTEAVEGAWRVRSLKFFEDEACSRPVDAKHGSSGEALGSEAMEMTGAEHALSGSPYRGWTSEGACAARACHVGFAFHSQAPVKCIFLQQDEGLHAAAVTLQRRNAGEAATWQDVISWSQVEGGKTMLSVACPPAPTVERGRVMECDRFDERQQECKVQCDRGFGAVEPRLRCVHGAWYSPSCLPVGSMLRLVAKAPEVIKPYWVVLDAALYEKSDCTGVLPMDGVGISSGEYVIKYASYHPNNAWDGNADSSWASDGPCKNCHVGFHFRRPLPSGVVRCVRIIHPERAIYHATEVAVQILGSSGWEDAQDVNVMLLPEVVKSEL